MADRGRCTVEIQGAWHFIQYCISPGVSCILAVRLTVSCIHGLLDLVYISHRYSSVLLSIQVYVDFWRFSSAATCILTHPITLLLFSVAA